jgi:putative FmdB family regulatory protein
MPIYEYKCDKCGNEFEQMRSFSDASAAICPACGGPDTHRLVSRTSFVLKGSGWYATDYAKKPAESASPATAPAAATASSGDAAPAAPAPAPSSTPAAEPPKAASSS